MATELYAKAHRKIQDIKGPLLFLEPVADVKYGERVIIVDSEGREKSGQVLDVGEQAIVVQVFEGSDGLGEVYPEVERPITGSPINPVCRQQPRPSTPSAASSPATTSRRASPRSTCSSRWSRARSSRSGAGRGCP